MKNSSFLLMSAILLVAGCKHDPDKLPTGYPANVEKIISTDCAISGCHNTTSKDAAAGLDLTTWASLFKGTTIGATVIPFRTDFSTFLYFVNVDSTLGILQKPTMPINRTHISTADYLILKNWIAQGAPNANGDVMFPDVPNTHKYYVANQGCDVVSVFDANLNIVTRMVDIGVRPGASPAESPHSIKITPDGNYWIVCFLTSDVVQVYSTKTDQLVMTIPIGDGVAGSWNSLTISSDSQTAYATDYSGGRIAFIDLVNGTSVTNGPFPITGGNPKLHGIALSQNNDTLYATCQDLSKILKIPVTDIPSYEDKDLKQTQSFNGELQPHEIIFSPDFSKYFVSCQNASQVRVYDTHNDHLITVITVGTEPEEFAMSVPQNLLFVSNEEDNFYPDNHGTISAIDMTTLAEVKRIKVGWQPHGIAVDDRLGLVYVANRNVSGGPAPHHSSACGGRNGYMTVVDIPTLKARSIYSTEMAVDPYAIGVVK